MATWGENRRRKRTRSGAQRVSPGAAPGWVRADPDAPPPEMEVILFCREVFDQSPLSGVDEITDLLVTEVTDTTNPYLRDAPDHVLQLADLIDSTRDMAHNLMAN